MVQLAVLLQVNVVALLKVVLVTLRRLIEERVDFAFAQQLDQLGERAVQHIVLMLEAFRRLRILTRVLRDFLVRGIVSFRFAQLFLRLGQQFINGGAAADLVGIHHVANTGTVQGVARLQQVNAAFAQLQLLLTNSLQDGKVFLIAFQRGEKESARNQLQGAKQHQHQQQAGDHLHTI